MILTFCCWSFFECFVMVFGGVTPILADLKDSKRFLIVLWKISCTSFSSWLTSKWVRLYLCRCWNTRERAKKWKLNLWICHYNHYCTSVSPLSCLCTDAAAEDGACWCPLTLSNRSWTARAFPNSQKAQCCVYEKKNKAHISFLSAAGVWVQMLLRLVVIRGQCDLSQRWSEVSRGGPWLQTTDQSVTH